MDGTLLSQEAEFNAAPEPIPLDRWLRALRLPDLTEIEVDVRVFRKVRFNSPVSAVVRGLLGERLRARDCLTGASQCEGCLEWRRCEYAGVFGTSIGLRRAPGGLGDLHPFWLQGLPAALEVLPGAQLTARLVTAGLGGELVHSLHLAFRDALGRLGEAANRQDGTAPLLSPSRAQRTPLAVARSDSDTWWIEARTPLLLTQPRHADHLPACAAASWLPPLLGAGMRRLKALAVMFGATDTMPPVALPQMDDIEIVSGELAAWNGSVVSRRQGRAFPLEDGIVGGALVRGSAMPVLGPLLQLLERTGVGKKTTMGFGHLAVEPVR